MSADSVQSAPQLLPAAEGLTVWSVVLALALAAFCCCELS